MIYLDNAATTLPKPTEVCEAVALATGSFGNPGRSACAPAMQAARAVFQARQAVARLLGLSDASGVAFTSGCTEAVSLLCRALSPADHVIATELEHNSVLRPLYLSGCQLDLLPADAAGRLDASSIGDRIRPNTRFIFASHGSNLTGNLTDIAALRGHGVPLVLDASQTVGCRPVDISMADALCFSGHKALFGPMGVGCLVLRPGFEALPVLKTGGTGYDSFSPLQQARMPDLAEAGTPNVPGIFGLLKGIEFIESVGLSRIADHDLALTRAFVDGLRAIEGLSLYGDFETWPRLPVVSFSLEGVDSAELSWKLWERREIATRAGSHCAPLLHRRLGSEQTGLVRCSFSWFNTLGEVRQTLETIEQIGKDRARHG